MLKASFGSAFFTYHLNFILVLRISIFWFGTFYLPFELYSGLVNIELDQNLHLDIHISSSCLVSGLGCEQPKKNRWYYTPSPAIKRNRRTSLNHDRAFSDEQSILMKPSAETGDKRSSGYITLSIPSIIPSLFSIRTHRYFQPQA